MGHISLALYIDIIPLTGISTVASRSSSNEEKKDIGQF